MRITSTRSGTGIPERVDENSVTVGATTDFTRDFNTQGGGWTNDS